MRRADPLRDLRLLVAEIGSILGQRPTVATLADELLEDIARHTVRERRRLHVITEPTKGTP